MKTTRPVVRFLAIAAAAGLAASAATSANAATKTTKKAAKAVKTTKAPATTKAAAATTSPSAPASTSAAPARAGVKIVEIQNGAEPPSWDSAVISGAGSAGSSGNRFFPLYGALFYMDPKTKVFTPLLADSFSSSDGVNWTLKLHPNVKFHDGTPFDAAAVKAHWDRIKDPATASPSRADGAQIESSTVVDPLTMRITLVQRNQQLQWSFQRSAMNYVPSPKAVTDKIIATKAVGAGPFIMKEFKRDDQLVMSANPGWPFWPGGRPNIEELTIKPIIDENQRFNNLATDKAQLVFTQFEPLRAQARSKGYTFTATEQEGGNTIIFNVARAPFDDARVRQALQQAIDLKQYKAVICQCDDEPTRNLFNDDSPYYDRNSDFNKFDLDAAQKLIDDYVAKVNGGRTLEITLGHFTSTANTVEATFFQTQWARLRNVRVNLDGVDSPSAQTRVIRGQFGVHLWGNLFTDPDELYNALVSTSNQNWGQFKSAAMDSALNIGRASTTAAERKAAYGNVSRQLNFEVPLIWYNRVPTSFLHPKNISNTVWYNDGVLRIDLLKIG